MNKQEEKEYQKQWRKNNPDYYKKWIEKNREKMKEYRRNYYKEHYIKKGPHERALEMVELYNSGVSQAEIARIFGCSRQEQDMLLLHLL